MEYNTTYWFKNHFNVLTRQYGLYSVIEEGRLKNAVHSRPAWVVLLYLCIGFIFFCALLSESRYLGPWLFLALLIFAGQATKAV